MGVVPAARNITNLTGLDDYAGPYAAVTVKTGVQASGTVAVYDLIIIDLSGGDLEQDLPAASTIDGWVEIKAINNANNTLTIDPDGSETIDGASTYTMDESNQMVRLQSDGSNWYVTGFFQDVAGPFGGTNLSVSSITSTTLDIVSDTGDNATIPQATTDDAGLMSAADKTVLDAAPTLDGDKEWSGANDFSGLLQYGVPDLLLDDPATGDDFSDYSGWTEETAPTNALASILDGYLRIQGIQSNTYYRIHKATGVSVADVAASQYVSFDFGPIYFSSGLWSTDLTWRFQICADDGAGNPDFDIYNGCELAWVDPAAGSDRNFYIRQITKDGTTEDNSDWVALRGDLGIFTGPVFRLNIRNNNDGRCNFYVGTNRLALVQERISQILTGVAIVDWGDDLHYVISRDRSTGVAEYVYIGGVDYNGAVQ